MLIIKYKKDLVSCVVPCYSAEKYLGDCLESKKTTNT